MKRYEVTWTELHSAFVEAKDETGVLDVAYLLEPVDTFDSIYEEDVSIREVDETGEPIDENL